MDQPETLSQTPEHAQRELEHKARAEATEVALEHAGQVLRRWTIAGHRPEPHRLDVVVDREHLAAAVTALYCERCGYLSALSGMDHPDTQELEALYHFCCNAAVVTLRVRVPYAAPVLPSICRVIPSASLYERELAEMFGIHVTDTPDPSRLFLPDDWPQDQPPLRKAYVVPEAAAE